MPPRPTEPAASDPNEAVGATRSPSEFGGRVSPTPAMARHKAFLSSNGLLIHSFLFCLSLSQIKSEHIGGVARRELGDKECIRPVRWRARPARPSPRIDACVPHYNISGKTAVHVGGAALRTQQRGQGIPVGSNRSAVRHIHFATGSVVTLVGH